MHSTHHQQQHPPHRPTPRRKCLLIHEVMSPGIMVSFTLIFESFEHFAKDLSLFKNVCLEFMIFSLFKPGGCHCVLVSWLPLGIGLYWMVL
jgi:hypothetical protein